MHQEYISEFEPFDKMSQQKLFAELAHEIDLVKRCCVNIDRLQVLVDRFAETKTLTQEQKQVLAKYKTEIVNEKTIIVESKLNMLEIKRLIDQLQSLIKFADNKPKYNFHQILNQYKQ